MPVSEAPRQMQCMEVWGGNVKTDAQLETRGLDVWISSHPEGESEAGGDVYYVSSCASGRITRLLLADVSGHGDLVSGCAVALRDLMRENVNTIGHSPFVVAMNRHFTEANDHSRFATAIVSSYFASTNSLSLCNAGHPPPFLYRDVDQTWMALDQSEAASNPSPLQVSDLPLGVISDTAYSEHKIRLNESDVVLCYTDAFSEARGADGDLLGVEGLLAVISSADPTDAAAFLVDVVDRIHALNPTNLTEDDSTILLFRANRLRSTVRDNVFAPFRLLGRTADSSQIVFPERGERHSAPPSNADRSASSTGASPDGA